MAYDWQGTKQLFFGHILTYIIYVHTYGSKILMTLLHIHAQGNYNNYTTHVNTTDSAQTIANYIASLICMTIAMKTIDNSLSINPVQFREARQ